jgi:putative ABC transport system substrate-binding protein
MRPSEDLVVDRRAFIGTVAGGLVAAPLTAEAQQRPKIPEIGFLTGTTPAGGAVLVEAFRQGMRELGYVEGKTFVLEARYAEGKSERVPELARSWWAGRST